MERDGDMKENYIAVELDLHRSDFGKYLFSHYDILDEIYRSENSQLFKIKELESNQIRVLKAIQKRPFLSFDYDGFKRIRHDHIVLVEQTGESEHFYYMVMEYIEGTTLENYIETFGPCSTELVQKIIHQIYQALEYLHHHYDGQLIYRDLKPSNIMISKGGKITLIDVNTLRMKKDLSNSDTYYIGSRGYTAPEAYGYAQSTETSDVYSLGATLFFLLTGNVPSVGSLFHEEIKSSNLNYKYRTIILKATKFNPKDRYQNVAAFKHDIAQPFVMKRIVVMAALLVVLAMAAGFGMNVYQSFDNASKKDFESDSSVITMNPASQTTEINPTEDSIIDITDGENPLGVATESDDPTGTETATEMNSETEEAVAQTTEPKTELKTEPTTVRQTEPSTESVTEKKIEPTTAPTTEPVTQATQDDEKPTILTPEETTENPNPRVPYTSADIENMKQAGKGLIILKMPGYVNITFDLANMDASLKNFKYISAGTSNIPYVKNSLNHLSYNATVLGYGFQTYTEEGFNETITAGDYLHVLIFDAAKKPIGYYFFNEPYTP